MAIWQFKVDLIPKGALSVGKSALPVTLTKELAEDSSWWSDIQPPVGFEEYINIALHPVPSWSDSMRIWGDEQGNAAVVCYNNDSKVQVESIEFHIDVRKVSFDYIRSICTIARDCECLIMTGNHEVILPEESMVLVLIESSTAKSYLMDPAATLRKIKQNAERATEPKTPGRDP